MAEENQLGAESVVGLNQQQPEVTETPKVVEETEGEVADTKVEGQEVTPEQEKPAETTQEAPKKKKSSGWHKKIARLERELAAERAKNSQSAAQAGTPEPQLANFPDYDSYNAARIRFETQNAVKEALLEVKSQDDQKESAKSWETKVEQVRQKLPDYDEVVSEYDDFPVRPDIKSFMAQSDLGPEIAYHLAANPELLDEINVPYKTPVTVRRKLEEIEERLANQASAKPAVKVSNAAAPINPVKKSAPTIAPDLATLDTESFVKARMQRYKKK